MSRFPFRSMTATFTASIGLALATAGAAQASETIRIEPRSFYGATVTLEAGVRVFRPLPVTKRVIVNPDNATPLSLRFKETTSDSDERNDTQK